MAARVLGLAIALAACAPEIPSPAERARAVDRDDADRLAAAISVLPGITAVHAELARETADPFAPLGATAPPLPPRAAVVVVAEAHVDADAIIEAARALAATAGVARERVAVVIARAPDPHAELANVGPFTVAASSAGALRATLLAALAAIAAAAGRVVLRHRRGNTPL